MKEKIKAVLDENCPWEKAGECRRRWTKRCADKCWSCHRNDALTDRLADIVEFKEQ